MSGKVMDTEGSRHRGQDQGGQTTAWQGGQSRGPAWQGGQGHAPAWQGGLDHTPAWQVGYDQVPPWQGGQVPVWYNQATVNSSYQQCSSSPVLPPNFQIGCTLPDPTVHQMLEAWAGQLQRELVKQTEHMVSNRVKDIMSHLWGQTNRHSF